MLLIDLDRFKEVNDTLGHLRGDVLLQEMALRLTDVVGGEEHVARLGGDEFGVLLRDLEGINEVVEWARKINQVMHRPFVNDGLPIQVSGSIGIALAPDHGTDGTTLLRRADVAMYEAKARGSSFEVYDQETDKYSTRRLAMAAELRSAIETDEVRLYYQPKADLASGPIIGVEALARWRHPRHGNVPPDEFVELAERTGLIGPLTDHVMRTAVRDIARLRNHPEEFVAVFQTNLVQPLAADRQWWMVQADHDVLGAGLFEYFRQPVHFVIIDTSTGITADAAVNAGNEPVIDVHGGTIVKCILRYRIAHQVANIMVAGHAVHRQFQVRHKGAKSIGGGAAVVLDQIARHGHQVGRLLNDADHRCIAAVVAAGRAR